MSIIVKTQEEIAKMRGAGRLAAEVLEMIRPHVVPGVTTGALDRICHDYIVNVQHAVPAPLNYKGFPKSICTSVNHQVCHGVPGEKKLKKGDILNIDVTIICEAPRIGPHREAMRARVADILGIAAARVNIKGKTTEKLGFLGRGEGIAAQAVASVSYKA